MAEARVTQFALEALISAIIEARVSQVAVEVLIPNRRTFVPQIIRRR